MQRRKNAAFRSAATTITTTTTTTTTTQGKRYGIVLRQANIGMERFHHGSIQAVDEHAEQTTSSWSAMNPCWWRVSWLISEYANGLTVHFQVEAGGSVGVTGRTRLTNTEQHRITITIEVHADQCLQMAR